MSTSHLLLITIHKDTLQRDEVTLKYNQHDLNTLKVPDFISAQP